MKVTTHQAEEGTKKESILIGVYGAVEAFLPDKLRAHSPVSALDGCQIGPFA